MLHHDMCEGYNMRELRYSTFDDVIMMSLL